MTLPDPSHFIAAGQSAEVFRLEGGGCASCFMRGSTPASSSANMR